MGEQLDNLLTYPTPNALGEQLANLPYTERLGRTTYQPANLQLANLQLTNLLTFNLPTLT
ncbi:MULTISPECIES: hypothetical protein [Moorena]|uniref:hypothetical protein n=1 Tax=Moorena TaxID=1155738 RepID=UPI0003139A8D|nr:MULTISPECIES: hypothetical protein [Moorena]NEP35202.1 hypothetical protein [Moorena sp. SIO3B2]NEP65782.1 hypothetical protein [Moorena sp. SIO3A5]OLT67116.1 hypothetical protein BI334_20725 [Moorena producens 3L]